MTDGDECGAGTRCRAARKWRASVIRRDGGAAAARQDRRRGMPPRRDRREQYARCARLSRKKRTEVQSGMTSCRLPRAVWCRPLSSSWSDYSIIRLQLNKSFATEWNCGFVTALATAGPYLTSVSAFCLDVVQSGDHI